MNLPRKSHNNFETVLDLTKINLRLRDQKYGSDLYLHMHPYLIVNELEHTCKYFVA